MNTDPVQSKYLRAARGERLTVPPVWLMRQAGRYLPEYLAVRERYSFLDACRTPEVACELTLQPIRRFGFDAAILFSDILIPLAPMGAEIAFGEGQGPVIADPVRSAGQIEALRPVQPRESLAFVLEAIRQIRAELPAHVALIGFTGAPFTLAAYLVEGGKPDPFARLKGLMYGDRPAFRRLLDKLGGMAADYLEAMIEAGADAVQLFDTWAGILPAREFRAVNLPVLQKIFARVKALNVPATYYALAGMHLLEEIRETGCSVAGLDWRIPLSRARTVLGDRTALQGNLDPTVLLGPEAVIRAEARRIVDEGRGPGGHIFNLGHGILPVTPVSAVDLMLDEIRREEP
ncbi:MAG: uroporphyrinogen decarboxylase [Candidatus Zixiibacteriota bacterium]|nr:MAG: uroporphyrinogen decarboxylase [candidate division Zixibacteria bacterium]